MRSYPLVLRLFQIGELNLSLGVLEPSYILEIMNQLLIDLLERSLRTWGVELYDLPSPTRPGWRIRTKIRGRPAKAINQIPLVITFHDPGMPV